MKKYLMTGIAALALCVGFTSCSHDLESLSQEEIDQLQAKKIVEKYNQAFIATFGQPAKNQNWGFGPSAGTRTRAIDPSKPQKEDARGNMWCLEWKVPDPLTEGQKLRVQKYFQYNQYPGGTTDPDLVNFFVQQVYDGHDDPLTDHDKTMVNDTLKYSEEQYLAADGENYINSGEHMDKLTAGSNNIHINNFNNGNCGAYDNVKDGHTYQTGYTPYTEETAEAAGKTWEDAQTENFNHLATHPDQIMLMLNTKTDCFGYWNSNGSVGHNDRYRLVSAAVIDAWIDANLGEDYGDKVVDDWNRDFIGFDFDQLLTEDCFAATRGSVGPYTAENNYQGTPTVSFESYHYYRYDLYGDRYHYLRTEMNFYCGKKEHYDPEPTVEEAKALLDEGWLPVDGKANKDWVKVGGCADGYFSDWIVTICKAEPINETTPTPNPFSADLRIMAEDLSADEKTDFDFNDIVFDVQFNQAATETNGGNPARIRVKAAGGTLPLRIKVKSTANHDDDECTGKEGNGWQEVHALWSKSTGIMINTNATTIVPGKGYEAPESDDTIIDLDYEVWDAADAINIIIEVNKGGQWNPMNAEAGEPAAKFATDDTNKRWADEREDLRDHSNFKDWVQGAIDDWDWYDHTND